MAVTLFVVALLLHGCFGFSLAPRASMRRVSAPLVSSPLSRVSMAESEPQPASETDASADGEVKESLEPSDAREDIDGNAYTVQAPMKVLPGLEGFTGFDFSGTQSIPTPARGERGLNEQGFEPYQKEEADKVTDSTYLIGLGAAALASIVLSVANMGGLS